MYVRVFVAIGAKYDVAPVISSTHHSWEAMNHYHVLSMSNVEALVFESPKNLIMLLLKS